MGGASIQWWEILVALLGALGGWETLKYFLNLKSNRRISESQADASEFHLLQEALEFLQSQLKQKEERFAEQTQVVRRLNAEVIELTREKAATELELAMKRCDEDDCPFRKPPNAKTPPMPEMSIEEWHEKKYNGKK